MTFLDPMHNYLKQYVVREVRPFALYKYTQGFYGRMVLYQDIVKYLNTVFFGQILFKVTITEIACNMDLCIEFSYKYH